MNKYLPTVAFVLFLSVNAFNRTVSTTSILLTVLTDNRINNQEKTISDLKNTPKFIPFVDQAELKINTVNPFSKTESWSERQRFSAKISPNGIGETRAARNVLNSTLDYNIHRKNKLINSLLKDRYMLILETLINNSKLKRDYELKILLEDRISVLDKMTHVENFDFTEIIKAETDYSELQLEIIELKNNAYSYENQINTVLNSIDSIDVDTSNLIDVATLKQSLQNTVINLDSNNIYLRDCYLKLISAQSLFKYENNENRKILSFLEFEFDADKLADEKREKNPEYNNAFGFGIGLTIPIVNVDRIDLNRRLIAMNDYQQDFYQEKKDLEDNARQLQAEISALIEQYEFLIQRQEQIRTESFLGKYMLVESENPLILLKIRQNIINNEEQMDVLKFKIYEKYVRMMDITGKISALPLRNILSKSGELLK